MTCRPSNAPHPRHLSARAIVRACATAAALTSAWAAQAAQPAVRGAEDASHRCGMIYTNHYGPIDYVVNPGGAKIVEDYHFTPSVRAAIGGATGPFGADINYTLKAVPNHHKALISLLQWVARQKRDQTEGMEWPVECYFDRAIRFRPSDTVVRALYAQFLAQRNRKPAAVQQLDQAATLAGEDGFAHYAIGLAYLDTGEPGKALQQAHRAQALGFPRRELADALRRAGAWREPQAAAAAGPASTPGPAGN